MCVDEIGEGRLGFASATRRTSMRQGKVNGAWLCFRGGHGSTRQGKVDGAWLCFRSGMCVDETGRSVKLGFTLYLVCCPFYISHCTYHLLVSHIYSSIVNKTEDANDFYTHYTHENDGNKHIYAFIVDNYLSCQTKEC